MTNFLIIFLIIIAVGVGAYSGSIATKQSVEFQATAIVCIGAIMSCIGFVLVFLGISGKI